MTVHMSEGRRHGGPTGRKSKSANRGGWAGGRGWLRQFAGNIVRRATEKVQDYAYSWAI